jgi:anaerobic magnesium-protoporphyrin IX monomethyl ester cyclase
MNQTDIVLVKPGSQKQLYGELSAFNLTAIEPPVWGALLASYLRNMGHNVVLIDAEIEGWSYEETAQQITLLKPVLVAIVVSGTNPSASTMNMTGAGAILRHLRQNTPETPTLLMGLHPSALPERTVREESVDFVCQGEGFYTLPRLLDELKSKGTDFRIDGLWFLRDGEVVSNPRPSNYPNLDELPIPAWDLLPIRKYRAHNWHCFGEINGRQPYAAIYTSFGCPFKCSFCCINALFGTSGIRYRSPELVIKEIEHLVTEYGVKNIKVIDEMFAINEARVVKFCDLIIERGFKLNLWAYARVNTVSERMLAKMKQAGFNWIAYGFESASKRVLKDVTKGYRIESAEEVVKMTKALGINICANFIFGLPEDDFESMHETLKFMLDINAEWTNIYSAMAYPGSQLYELAVSNNWPLPKSWQNYSQYAYETLPLPTKYLSGGQVLAFRDYAFDTYYRTPRYINIITSKFGLEAANHIKAMASKKLLRKHAIY